MDKESYETYEYMPDCNPETEPYQFFVVQDDGTFLINRQVQYVAQVEDNKEALEGIQSSPMLDVAPQQFFVTDVDNPTELISVSDPFSLPGGSSNTYASSYLLQPSATDNVVEQINSTIVEQQKDVTLQGLSTIAEDIKPSTNLTEITLTDEQYHMLEQKGWILLETNEKVYVLDTLGLHDITTNNKLIQKLKAELLSDSNLETESGLLKIEFPNALGGIAEGVNVQNTVEFQEAPHIESIPALNFIVSDNKAHQTLQKTVLNDNKQHTVTQKAVPAPKEDIKNEACESNGDWSDENVLRIKTDFSVKDIPDKIVLGKTVNGKRLVCRVIRDSATNDNNNQVKRPKLKIKPEEALPKVSEGPVNSIPEEIDDEKLDVIIKTCLNDNNVICTDYDVIMADRVVRQLLRLPAVKPSITNRNLFITQVTAKLDEAGAIANETAATLVTGKIQMLEKEWHFVHKPDLHTTAKLELTLSKGIDFNFLHIHVHETKREDTVLRTSVTINKRRLELSSTEHAERIFIPDLPFNNQSDINLKKTMLGFACGTCAAIFQTESELKSHQEIHNIDTDDRLTIDTEPASKNNGILVSQESGKKVYTCMQCNASFLRMNNCQRHVKTHTSPGDADSTDEKKRIYKCKICYSFFHHAPTLLKHIMKKHIKVDS